MSLNFAEIRKIASRVVSETEPAPLHERKAVERELMDAITKDRSVMEHNARHDIDMLIAHLLDPNKLPITQDRLQDWLRDLRSCQDQTTEWSVLFGLENVTVVTPTEIGSAVLKPGGSEFEQEYIDWLRSVNQHAFEHRDTPAIVRHMLRSLSAPSYAIVKVDTGGPGRAIEIARDKCSEVLALLRYFAHLSGIDAPIGILGQPTASGGGAIAVSSTAIGTSLNPRGNVQRLELDVETVGWMRYNHMERAELILGKWHRSELENRFVAGLRWFGESLVETNATDRFVKCVICLEALLGQKNPDENITAPLAEKVAFLLHQGGTVADRVATYKRVKALYGRRSQIVHTGRFAGDGEDAIHQSTDLCGRLLGVFISSDILDRFQRWEDLSGWFDELRFSC